ncbi:hypothetical protein UY3_06538, partial [Chelonia mydas]
ANYQALMSKYDFLNYVNFAEFTVSLIHQDRAYFKTLIYEGKLIASIVLQSVIDATDTSSRAMATAIIMCRESWLHASGFPKVVQNTIEDLPFNESNLFNQKTESLHTLKDSMATICSLEIYMPVPKRKFHCPPIQT